MMFEFNYMLALYRRNNFGQPCIWCAEPFDDDTFYIYHGIIGKTITKELIKTNRTVKEEINSRINAKRKTGYKLLSELKDNVQLPVEGELMSYLDKYLPISRTSADGNLLPMLAKVYDNTNNKLFKKCSQFIGQWKINGLRCFVSAERNEGNLFRPIKLNFQSREGTIWNSLADLEDYLLLVLGDTLLNKMVEEHYILDGEIYLPGHSVNEINHFVKDATCKENKLLQYWCYDVAIDDTIQMYRHDFLFNTVGGHCIVFKDINSHLNNINKFVLLPTVLITNDTDATYARDKFINMGFEGLILRNPNAEYQYGKRNLSMIKYKRATDGKFTVIDIYPEGVKRSNIPLLLCRNDINDATFEVHIGGSHDYQKSILVNKNKYIGKTLHINYGERSGVNQLPFHVKDVMFID